MYPRRSPRSRAQAAEDEDCGTLGQSELRLGTKMALQVQFGAFRLYHYIYIYIYHWIILYH